jgi:hypothetical protein
MGDDLKVDCPTDSGNYLTLFAVARKITNHLGRIFLRDENGQRPL